MPAGLPKQRHIGPSLSQQRGQPLCFRFRDKRVASARADEDGGSRQIGQDFRDKRHQRVQQDCSLENAGTEQKQRRRNVRAVREPSGSHPRRVKAVVFAGLCDKLSQRFSLSD